MVDPVGLEPTTSCLQGRYSSQLKYEPRARCVTAPRNLFYTCRQATLFLFTTNQACCIPCITPRLPLDLKQKQCKRFAGLLFAFTLRLGTLTAGRPNITWETTEPPLYCLFTENSRLGFSPYLHLLRWGSPFVFSHLLNYLHLSRLPIGPGQLTCILLSIAIISSLSVNKLTPLLYFK